MGDGFGFYDDFIGACSDISCRYTLLHHSTLPHSITCRTPKVMANQGILKRQEKRKTAG